ncbi:MAG: hypothetical protein R8K48_01885 [Gallionella sp.]
MFSRKLVWLLVILWISPSAMASETRPMAQFLIDRAHYWSKRGNRDLELIIWQEVLQIEPDNAEALNRIAPGTVVKPSLVSSNKMDVDVKSIARPYVVSKVEPTPVVLDVLAKEIEQDDVSTEAAALSEGLSAPAQPATASLPVESVASPVIAEVSTPVEPASKPGKAAPVEEWSALTAGEAKKNVKAGEPEVETQVGVLLKTTKTLTRKVMTAVDSMLKMANQPMLKKMRVGDANGNASHLAEAQIGVSLKMTKTLTRKVMTAVDSTLKMTNHPMLKKMRVSDASGNTSHHAEAQIAVDVKSIAVPRVVSKVEPTPVVEVVLAKEIAQDDASTEAAAVSEGVSTPAQPATALLPVEPVASPVAAEVSTSLEPASKRGKAVPVEEWSALTADGAKKNVNAGEPEVKTQVGVSLQTAKTPASKAMPRVDSTLKVPNHPMLKKMRVSDANGNASHLVAAQIAVMAKPDRLAAHKSLNNSSAIKNKSMEVLAVGGSVNHQDEVNNRAKTMKPVPTSPDAIVLSGAVRGADKKLQQDLLNRRKGLQGGRQRDGLDNKVNVNKVVKAKGATTVRIIPYPKMHPQLRTRVRTQAKAKPTARELTLKAQYWQSRGRVDLAEQIRRKIQRFVPEQVISHPVQAQPVVTTKEYPMSGKQNSRASALEDRLLNNPNALKVKLDLAQIYRSIGETPRARVLIDRLLVNSPDLPEARYVSAQLYADQHLWMETLHELEKISSVSRTRNMGKLQKSAWAHVQLDRADALARQGRNAEADRVLRQVAAKLVIHDVMMPVSEPPPLWTAPIRIKKASAGTKHKKHVSHQGKHTVKRSVPAKKMQALMR